MKFLYRLSLVLVCSAIFAACLKKDYDNPPDTSQYDPNLPVQISLRNLSDMVQAMPTGKSRIVGDTTISGVIIANDKSGNFYKQIIIQDTSKGGIVIYIDRTGLYADYPVGRKVYIKLKDLALINYRGLPEVVFSADSVGNTTGIPGALLNDVIIKASYPNKVDTNEATIIDVVSNPGKYISTLIKIKDVQFNNTSSNVPYANSSSVGSGTSRYIEDCSRAASVAMYNSNYAQFQPVLTPTGSGTLYCVGSVFYSTLQLLIRDTADVQFNKPRCP